MQALVHDPEAPHGLRLGQVPDPEPGPSDVLVQVAATSLNFGEIAFLRGPALTLWRPSAALSVGRVWPSLVLLRWWSAWATWASRSTPPSTTSVARCWPTSSLCCDRSGAC